MAAARAQYRRVPDAQYLTDWGMPAEQFADAFQALVWPENWLAWCLQLGIAWLMLSLAYAWFKRLQPGFADVL